MRRCLVLLLPLVLACEGQPAAPPAPAVEAPAPVTVAPLPMPARELPLELPGKNYPATLGQAVDEAVYLGLYQAMDGLQRQMDKGGNAAGGAPAHPASVGDRPKGSLLTLWFTGNVHGEREDCGCKKHPLGGLARKATIIRNAKSSGRELDHPDGQLIVDAGNLLFAAPSMSQLPAPMKAGALIDAEAVVAAFNEIGCDAFAVGEQDLAMGLEALLQLQKKAKFPWVSANLRRAGAPGLLLPPFVVREVAGVKVLVLGLTNPNASQPDGYKAAGVEVTDAREALASQAEAVKAQAPDVVVLLSNLGMDETAKLLEAAPFPIHSALVSGSSRSTYQPVWAGQTAMLEPANRGKYLGRADLHIVDGQVAFSSEESSQLRQVREYMNSYRSLNNARRAWQDARRLKAQKNGAVTPGEDAREERIKRNLELAVERLALVESGLPARLEVAAPAEGSQSWMHTQVVPVELAIEQAPDVRKVLDQYAARAQKARGEGKP